MPKYSPEAQAKIGRVLREFHKGALTTRGRKVTDPAQAKAIALAEARRRGLKVPSRRRRRRRQRSAIALAAARR